MKTDDLFSNERPCWKTSISKTLTHSNMSVQNGEEVVFENFLGEYI